MAMLLALVGKATSAALLQRSGASGGPVPIGGDSTERDLAGALAQVRNRSVRAIWWGIAAAFLASVVTAVALNFLISSSAGAARNTRGGRDAGRGSRALLRQLLAGFTSSKRSGGPIFSPSARGVGLRWEGRGRSL